MVALRLICEREAEIEAFTANEYWSLNTELAKADGRQLTARLTHIDGEKLGKLGIPNENLNVNGGSISIGHPYGMSGARLVGHALYEGKRRKVKYAIVTMCIGGGQGAAGLFEVL